MPQASIHDLHAPRKTGAMTYYATYHDVYGTAEMLNGTGYLFRKDRERRARVVHYSDPHLILLGRVDLADAQRALEERQGGLAARICGYSH